MPPAKRYKLDTKVKGATSDDAATVGSLVIVVASGILRKSEMMREELIGANGGIEESVTGVLKYSPNTTIVMIANSKGDNNHISAIKTASCPKKRSCVVGYRGAEAEFVMRRKIIYRKSGGYRRVSKRRHCTKDERI